MSTDAMHLADRVSLHAFGETAEDHQRATHQPFATQLFVDAKRIVERPEILAALAKWQAADRNRKYGYEPSRGVTGWKPSISIVALLVLMLVHLRAGRGLVFADIAVTLTHRMTPKHFEYLGVVDDRASYARWYNRLFTAKNRLEELIDHLPGPRHKKPTFEEFVLIDARRQARKAELDEKQKRQFWLMNALVESSVSLLPAEVRARFSGNIAIDATKVRMLGKKGLWRDVVKAKLAGEPLPRKMDPGTTLINTTNYDAGFYTRDGDHDGTSPGTKMREFALEVETVVTLADGPGLEAEVPTLTVGVGIHVPGETQGAAKPILESLEERNYKPGHLIADMAYPKGEPEDFLGVARNQGRTAVFDYPITQLGSKASFFLRKKAADETHRLILVEGSWYVYGMPELLQNAYKEYREAKASDRKNREYNRRPDKTKKGTIKLRPVLTAQQTLHLRETLEKRLAQRAFFRMAPHGRPLPDGSQRFTYPDPSLYTALNPDTKEELPPAPTSSVTIKREHGLGYYQAYVHKSDEWRAWFGMRNAVEAHNAYLKDPLYTDIEESRKRPSRGNTFAFLAATLGVVTANIRKIESYIRNIARGTRATSKNRYGRVELVEGSDDFSGPHLSSEPPPPT